MYVCTSDCRLRLKRDGTCAETRLLLSPKRTSPFKSAGASFQSNTGSRGVRISVSNAGYTTFRGSMRILATHSIRQFRLHFPSRASPCAIRFQTHSTKYRDSVANCSPLAVRRSFNLRHVGLPSIHDAAGLTLFIGHFPWQ